MLAKMIIIFIFGNLDYLMELKKLIVKILFFHLFRWLTIGIYGGVANIFLWFSHTEYTVFLPQKQATTNSYKLWYLIHIHEATKRWIKVNIAILIGIIR